MQGQQQSILTYNVGLNVKTGIAPVVNPQLVNTGFGSGYGPPMQYGRSAPPPLAPTPSRSSPPPTWGLERTPSLSRDSRGASRGDSQSSTEEGSGMLRTSEAEGRDRFYSVFEDESTNGQQRPVSSMKQEKAVPQIRVEEAGGSDQPAATAEEQRGQPRRSSRERGPPDRFQPGIHNVDVIDVLAAAILERQKTPRNKSADQKKRSDSKEKKSSSNNSDKRKSRSDDKKSDKKSRSKSDRSSDRSKSNDKRSSDRSSDKKKARKGSESTDRSQSRDRSKSSNRDSRRSRSESRDKSKSKRSKSWSSKEMERGLNCHKDYDPTREKRCLKCLTEDQHHEFQCKKYHRRSKFKCKLCNSGFHWPDECDVEPPVRGNK